MQNLAISRLMRHIAPGFAALAAVVVLPAGEALANEAVEILEIKLLQPVPDERCKPSPIDRDQFRSFNEAMLDPDAKPRSFAELFKDMPPEMLAKIGEFQKTQEEQQKRDWANLCRYESENAAVQVSGIRPNAVFIGDSITENWIQADPSMFNAEILDRGISGQTTPQILLRFYQDVVQLRPRVVHIMAGTNDVAGNTGPATDEAILNNIKAMIDMAKANRIAVVLAGIPPAKTFGWQSQLAPAQRIIGLNQELARIAKQRRVRFIDYAAVLADDEGGLSTAYGNDGVHPHRGGYAVMRPLAEKAIARARR